MLRKMARDATHPQTRIKPHGERYGTERDGTEGRDCSGKSSSLRTDWKGFGQDHQEHVRWHRAGGQAAGQGLHMGAQEQRPIEGGALIEKQHRTSGPIPKFASARVTFRCELRNLRTTSNFMILVRF